MKLSHETKVAFSSALFGTVIGAVLSYGAVQLSEAQQRDTRRDWFAFMMIIETARQKDILERIVTGAEWTNTAMGSSLPYSVVASEALKSGLFADESVDPDISIALATYMEKLETAQHSLSFYRQVYLARRSTSKSEVVGLSDEELNLLRNSCANALASTSLMHEVLAAYDKARRVTEKRKIDFDRLGKRLEEKVKQAHSKRAS